MTTQEFSNTFDTLLNSYANQAMFGDQASKSEIVLDEYEKSILLTQAQDIIVKQYFERSNISEGFDGSIRRQVDFSNLVSIDEISSSTSSTIKKFAENSLLFKLPTTTLDTTSKVLFILNEKIVLTKNNKLTKVYISVPINYKEYDRQMTKPFAQPLKKQCWRLLQEGVGLTTESLYAEIILTDAANSLIKEEYTPKYKIRYIRRPNPIILTNLKDTGLTIDGNAEVTECELNPILHMDILNKAVEIAYSTRGSRPVQQSNQQQQ